MGSKESEYWVRFREVIASIDHVRAQVLGIRKTRRIAKQVKAIYGQVIATLEARRTAREKGKNDE